MLTSANLGLGLLTGYIPVPAGAGFPHPVPYISHINPQVQIQAPAIHLNSHGRRRRRPRQEGGRFRERKSAINTRPNLLFGDNNGLEENRGEANPAHRKEQVLEKHLGHMLHRGGGHREEGPDEFGA